MFFISTTVHQAISFNMDHGNNKIHDKLEKTQFAQEDCTSMAVPRFESLDWAGPKSHSGWSNFFVMILGGHFLFSPLFGEDSHFD